MNDLVERFRRLGYPSTAPQPGRQLDASELEQRVASVLRATFGDDVIVEETEED